MSQSKLNVKIIEHTPNPEKVIAMAGKLCYSPCNIDELQDNLTEENAKKFVNMLMSMGHYSPIEHVTFTFAVEGISRSLSHQLIRHRIASYSQKSQRYVKEGQFEYIVPKEIENNNIAKKLFISLMETAQCYYNWIVQELLIQYIDDYRIKNGIQIPDEHINKINDFKQSYKKQYSEFEKKAIENARYVLPNACETKIVFTMNIRSLMNFFQHRCCVRAQDEIRQLANEMLKQCREVAPTLFKYAGASCVMNGTCPEGKMSCGKVATTEEVLKIAKENNMKVVKGE